MYSHVPNTQARKFGGLTTGATDENGQPDPKFFQLGGFSISMFAGRIKFKNLQYTDRDLSITVMDGGIDLRYWVRHYKKSIGGSGKERVKVRLSGLSCHVYNRGKTYAALKHLSEMVDLQFDDAGDSLYDVKPIGPDETFPETELPWLMKIVPVVRVNVTGGRYVEHDHRYSVRSILIFANARNVLIDAASLLATTRCLQYCTSAFARQTSAHMWRSLTTVAVLIRTSTF